MVSIVRAQFSALLYWPAVEFMKRVFTTSTGDATIVVQKPAPNAAVKWQGRLSNEGICVRQQEHTNSHNKSIGFVGFIPVMRSYFNMSSLIMS